MLVLMLIALGLGAFTMVYLWVVSARLDRIQERQKRIDADLKRRKNEFKKAQRKERKVVLTKNERENFELFKKLLFRAGQIEYNKKFYILVGEDKVLENGSSKMYEVNEAFWREINEEK